MKRVMQSIAPPSGSALEHERAARRREWLVAVLNRWNAASGAVALSPVRVAVFAQELDRIGYSAAQATTAEAWILRGRPTRFGILTLADFFPTTEQIAEISFDASVIERRAEARGYQLGFDAARNAEYQHSVINRKYRTEKRDGRLTSPRH